MAPSWVATAIFSPSATLQLSQFYARVDAPNSEIYIGEGRVVSIDSEGSEPRTVVKRLERQPSKPLMISMMSMQRSWLGGLCGGIGVGPSISRT